MNTSKAMTKAEFKRRWESDPDGGGITFDDIADCAVARGGSRCQRRQGYQTLSMSCAGGTDGSS